MDLMEIILLIAGGIIFVLSFVLPNKREEISKETKSVAKEEIATMVSKEMESVRGQVDDVIDEAITYAMEKTERSLERLSNEKIMAVSEYSETVLADIHKNHEEAMFLYDMLNSKHDSIKNTVSEVNKTVRDAEMKVNDFQMLKPESLSEAEQKKVKTPASPAKKTATPKKDSTDKKTTAKKNTKFEPVPNSVENVSFLQNATGDVRNSNEKILELFRQGKSKVAIAKELGLGVGEVNLVIELNRSK